MPAPKGHLPYAGCEKGGLMGYLGKPQDAYTKEDIEKLGKELLEWFIENPSEIWLKEFFAYRGIHVMHIEYLKGKYPLFKQYYDQAKAIQECRLIKYPFWKKADSNHAKFVLQHAHDDFKQTQIDKSTEIAIAATYISDEIKKRTGTNVGNSSSH